jgi:hypothetical protein
MASSYSTDLKLELMVTGENSGTWGDKTNTNLNLIQQAIAGFESIALTSTNTTLSMTNAAISDARNAVLKFTGAITANCTVFVASGIEKTYILENGTIVYGLVEVDTIKLRKYKTKKIPSKLYHLLTTDGSLIINSIDVKDYNNLIDKFII